MDDLQIPEELPDAEGVRHEHPDVTGGWLRPTVFGAMDGLVSNFALIMGVTGGTTDPEPVVIAGLAGLAAGAFSMAAGEYTSVASQRELAEEQVAAERREIRDNGRAEEAELAAMFVDKGVDEDVARVVAQQIHRDPETAVAVHAQEEMGIDVDELASPWTAAFSSFLAFAVGALIPLLPLMLGVTSSWPTIGLSLVALFACGAVVTRITSRSWWFGGVRQLVLGGAAAGLTYLIGEAIGSRIG
ncbi:VIT1/CCC1 transporter family protein [Aeromicrobium marinum]|nr:VIT1/CCC1 transporter family protein [Aeromicrobium marinum]